MQGKPAVRKAMVVTPSSLTQARLLTLLVLCDAAAASSAVAAVRGAKHAAPLHLPVNNYLPHHLFLRIRTGQTSSASGWASSGCAAWC